MSIDISNLLSVYNSSLLNKATSNLTNTAASSNFSDTLMDVLSNRNTTASTDENALYKTLTSATNSNMWQGLLATGDASNALSQYFTNYSGNTNTNSILESYFNNANSTKSNEYFSDKLASSFETKITNVLTSAKTKLENNMSQYAEKMGNNKSEAVQQTITRMQNNISVLDNYLSQKSTENSLMQALNSNSSLTQYLINKNNGTL